ncbi:MAG TPA: glycoside hydrolase family 30 beta sandwich domain-containing protein, partial [Polyangiaceae bacterium]|nr:glycoside hydrolase family 30 beta sandwich domain-containing protein [Polyangiaceae bacterium]
SIFVGTMSNSQTDGGVLSAVMNDATAKPFVKGFGLQWGMIDTYGSLALDKSLPIWQTEHKCGNYPWVNGTNQSKAPNDFAYGVETWGLIRDWIKKGVTSYSAWNMVLDTVGKSVDTVRPWAQNALLTVDTSSKKLNITAAYYVFRHISQYVDVGAKVVGTSGGDALAFKNPDGTIVLVMYNSGAAKKATVKLGGKMLQFDMPDKGWATVNWK